MITVEKLEPDFFLVYFCILFNNPLIARDDSFRLISLNFHSYPGKSSGSCLVRNFNEFLVFYVVDCVISGFSYNSFKIPPSCPILLIFSWLESSHQIRAYSISMLLIYQ